jgi:hypothetical protein
MADTPENPVVFFDITLGGKSLLLVVHFPVSAPQYYIPKFEILFGTGKYRNQCKTSPLVSLSAGIQKLRVSAFCGLRKSDHRTPSMRLETHQNRSRAD